MVARLHTGVWWVVGTNWTQRRDHKSSLLLRPIHAPLVPDGSGLARGVRSANADQHHPNPETLQDRFNTLRFKSQSIRHRNHDLIVAVPRSSAQCGVCDPAFVGGHAPLILHLRRIATTLVVFPAFRLRFETRRIPPCRWRFSSSRTIILTFS